jgi:hypothetical protein
MGGLWPVEAADFDDGHIAALRAGLFAQPVEERAGLLPFGADLPAQDDVSGLVSNADGQLLAVLVDSDVYHDWFAVSFFRRVP